jgi:hypothetical protein
VRADDIISKRLWVGAGYVARIAQKEKGPSVWSEVRGATALWV